MKTNKRASETQINKSNKLTSIKTISTLGLQDNLVTIRNGGLKEMSDRLQGLKTFLSDPTRRPSKRVIEFYNDAVKLYENAVRASIGMPTYSDSVTMQFEAPSDIPTLPLDGYQLVHRMCLVEKLASSGTAAGGFYANLVASDLAPFVKTSWFRVKSVTSWTGTLHGSVGSQFAGVSVPVGNASDGTEVMPMWSENWQAIGSGFAGIKTQYPLGDFPQISTTASSVIVSHFTALGGTNGPTGIPVIFHVEIECLI